MPVEITVSAILADMDGTLVDSTPAVEKTMREWCQVQGIDAEVFFKVSHVRPHLGSRTKVSLPLTHWLPGVQGVRTRDNVRKFQRVPVPGTELSEEELVATVHEIEMNIANNGKALAAAGGQGIILLPGVSKLLGDLRAGGARWGICTSGKSVH